MHPFVSSGLSAWFSVILHAFILAMLTLAELKLRLLLQLGESRHEPVCERTCCPTCCFGHVRLTQSPPSTAESPVAKQ